MSSIRPPDDHRLEALLERYGRLLAATIRRVCPRNLGIDTQDVEQEARVRLWRALGRALDAEPNPTYVHKVAASAAIDAVRAATARRDRTALALPAEDDPERPVRDDPPESPGSSPEDRTRRRQVAEAIDAALGELAPARRRAVRLHLWGMSSPEIARLAGWSETKTRSLVSRGLGDLRRRLVEKGIDRDAADARS